MKKPLLSLAALAALALIGCQAFPTATPQAPAAPGDAAPATVADRYELQNQLPCEPRDCGCTIDGTTFLLAADQTAYTVTIHAQTGEPGNLLITINEDPTMSFPITGIECGDPSGSSSYIVRAGTEAAPYRVEITNLSGAQDIRLYTPEGGDTPLILVTTEIPFVFTQTGDCAELG